MISIVENNRKKMLNKREQLIIFEIGYDEITSASSFVEYISNIYRFSKSSVWYSLNHLKAKNIVYFATKDHPGQTLVLTKFGVTELNHIKNQGFELVNYFKLKEKETEKYMRGQDLATNKTIDINISI